MREKIWLKHKKETRDFLTIKNESEYREYLEEKDKSSAVTFFWVLLLYTVIGIAGGFVFGMKFGTRKLLEMMIKYPELFEGMKSVAERMVG